MAPTISVIIPAYNAAATLARALDSVLAQTWHAHEIIVVDDGSTDATVEVVESYGGLVRYLRQENAGPSAARNHGVSVANGDWIAFLDADDWYYTDRLAQHAQMIIADSTMDFLVGSFDYRDNTGALLHNSMSTCSFGRELLAQYGEHGQAVIEGAALGRFITDQFSDTRMLTLPRSTFLDLGGFPLELKICEDVVFLLHLCARSQRVGVSCASGAVYLIHDAGLIRSDRLRAQTETVRALRNQASVMTTAPPPIRAAWKQMVKNAYLNLAYYLSKHGQRTQAILKLARSFGFSPEATDLRHMLSILRG